MSKHGHHNFPPSFWIMYVDNVYATGGIDVFRFGFDFFMDLAITCDVIGMETIGGGTSFFESALCMFGFISSSECLSTFS